MQNALQGCDLQAREKRCPFSLHPGKGPRVGADSIIVTFNLLRFASQGLKPSTHFPRFSPPQGSQTPQLLFTACRPSPADKTPVPLLRQHLHCGRRLLDVVLLSSQGVNGKHFQKAWSNKGEKAPVLLLLFLFFFLLNAHKTNGGKRDRQTRNLHSDCWLSFK